MTHSAFEWRQTVIDHYGSIENFADATTIRTMLNMCEAWLKEDARIIDGIKGIAAQEEYAAIFADERQVYTELKVELEAWLAGRGLER